MNSKDDSSDSQRGIDAASAASAIGCTRADAARLLEEVGVTAAWSGICKYEEVKTRLKIANPLAYVRALADKHVAEASRRAGVRAATAARIDVDRGIRLKELSDAQVKYDEDMMLLASIHPDKRPALIAYALERVTPFVRSKCEALGWNSAVLQAVICEYCKRTGLDVPPQPS